MKIETEFDRQQEVWFPQKTEEKKTVMQVCNLCEGGKNICINPNREEAKLVKPCPSCRGEGIVKIITTMPERYRPVKTTIIAIEIKVDASTMSGEGVSVTQEYVLGAFSKYRDTENYMIAEKREPHYIFLTQDECEAECACLNRGR